MALDIVGILLITLFFIRGYMKGFIVAAFSVIAILLGIICSLKLSQAFASWLMDKGYATSGWAQVISYLALFIGVLLLVRILAKVIEKALEGMMLGVANKVIGGLLYAFLAAILWSSLLWIATPMHMLSPEMMAASKTYSWFAKLAPWFFDVVGGMLPFAKDVFAKLEHFFDAVNQKPANVDAH
jgi:membrane protein required for colicin V production